VFKNRGKFLAKVGFTGMNQITQPPIRLRFSNEDVVNAIYNRLEDELIFTMQRVMDLIVFDTRKEGDCRARVYRALGICAPTANYCRHGEARQQQQIQISNAESFTTARAEEIIGVGSSSEFALRI